MQKDAQLHYRTGSKAAVHSRMTVRAKATGNVMETELFDLVEIRDGKIASFTQFFDTASAMAMLQPQAGWRRTGSRRSPDFFIAS